MQSCIKKIDVSTEYFFAEGCYITELSNSDHDPQLSIAKARIKPGVTTKLHKLSATIERYVVIEGEGLVEIQGLKPQKLAMYDVAVISPDCSQKITNTGSVDLIFLAICSPRFIAESYVSLENE